MHAPMLAYAIHIGIEAVILPIYESATTEDFSEFTYSTQHELFTMHKRVYEPH